MKDYGLGLHVVTEPQSSTQQVHSRAVVLEAVLGERIRQDKLWGDQSHHTDAWWNVIASEENGEVAREVYEQQETKLFIEVVQACAVYFAWAEALHKRSQDEANS